MQRMSDFRVASTENGEILLLRFADDNAAPTVDEEARVIPERCPDLEHRLPGEVEPQ